MKSFKLAKPDEKLNGFQAFGSALGVIGILVFLIVNIPLGIILLVMAMVCLLSGQMVK